MGNITTAQRISLHRFHDTIAINPPEGPTFYMSLFMAQTLYVLLGEVIEDTFNREFKDSQFNSTTIDATGEILT